MEGLLDKLVADPAMANRLWDGLFWLLVSPAVGWLGVFALRSVSPKTGAFLKPVQTFLGWAVVAVACVYGALITIVVGWLQRFIPF